jgi:hypothetical protein
MATFKHNVSVALTDFGMDQLGSMLRLWIKESPLGGYYISCNSVDPVGPYFHMRLQMQHTDSEVIDFDVQVPHACIRAVITAADLKKLGFV